MAYCLLVLSGRSLSLRWLRYYSLKASCHEWICSHPTKRWRKRKRTKRYDKDSVTKWRGLNVVFFPRNRQPSVKKGGTRTSCLHGKQHQQQKTSSLCFCWGFCVLFREKKFIDELQGGLKSLDQWTNRTRNVKQNVAGSALLIAWDKLPERSFGNERQFIVSKDVELLFPFIFRH